MERKFLSRMLADGVDVEETSGEERRGKYK
jgi:hypothetical protein